MNPSRAMGTFLRVWRSEWAGLSRAQLAITVNAHCPERRQVTTGVIRKWESGQPPNSTEELEALCLVMRRHGLAAFEAQQFRQAVFAACVDRHYPELFAEDDFAQRKDVDEVARAMWHAAENHNRDPLPNVVVLVASVEDLRQEVQQHLAPPSPGTQAHRQEVALARLLHGLAAHHGHGGRPMVEIAARRSLAALVEHRLGTRPEAERYARENPAVLLYREAQVYGSRRALRQLIEAHQKAAAHGEEYHAAWLLLLVSQMGEMSVTRDALPLVTQGMARTLRGLAPGQVACAHASFARVHLFQGHSREAERHLAAIAAWETGTEWQRFSWQNILAKQRLAEGRYSEALSALQSALAWAESHGTAAVAANLRRDIERCEHLQHTQRYRKAKGRKLTRPAK